MTKFKNKKMIHMTKRWKEKSEKKKKMSHLFQGYIKAKQIIIHGMSAVVLPGDFNQSTIRGKLLTDKDFMFPTTHPAHTPMKSSFVLFLGTCSHEQTNATHSMWVCYFLTKAD